MRRRPGLFPSMIVWSALVVACADKSEVSSSTDATTTSSTSPMPNAGGAPVVQAGNTQLPGSANNASASGQGNSATSSGLQDTAQGGNIASSLAHSADSMAGANQAGSGGAGAAVVSGGIAGGGSAGGGTAGGGTAEGSTAELERDDALEADASAAQSNSGQGQDAGAPSPADVDQSQLPEVTLHLAGDSTVMTYDAGSAQEGWGQELGQFFIDKLTINNQAIGGASIRTFQTGRWLNILSKLQAGDYVMIQFGANDSGTVAGRHVEPDDFAAALGEMVDDVESKAATAIFVTPSALQQWSGGVEGNQRLGPYADAMRTVGPMRDVLVDDLNARSVELLNEIGQVAAQDIYINGDKAHFTQIGAIQMAQIVAEELYRIQSPLGAYVVETLTAQQ